MERSSTPHILPFLGIDAEMFPTSYACLVAPWMSCGTILTYLQDNEPHTTEVDRLVHPHIAACFSETLILLN